MLGGEDGPRRSLVVLNAGAAIFVEGSVSSFEQGVRLAEETIDSGAALEVLERFIARTQELAPVVQA